MAVGFLHGAVGIAVVEDRAVVAAEKHQRVLAQVEPVERLQELADAPVQLFDGVAAQAALALADERFVGRARHVDVVDREVEEQRPLAVLPEEFLRRSTRVRAISSSFHQAACPPAIQPMRLMRSTIVPLCCESAGYRSISGWSCARWLVAEPMLVADRQRIGLGQPAHAISLYIRARHAIGRCGNDERIIEPDVQRPRRDPLVPVERAGAQPQVPLAHARSRVPRAAEHLRKRDGSRTDDQGASPGKIAAWLLRNEYSPVSNE